MYLIVFFLSPPRPTHPISVLFYLGFYTYQVQFSMPVQSWVCVLPLKCAWFTRGNTLKKTDSPSPSSSQLQYLLSSGGTLCLLHAGIWSGLSSPRSCACCHKLWVHTCSCPVWFRRCYFLEVTYDLWLLYHFCFPFPWWCLSLGWRKYQINAIFATEQPMASYSLRLDQLWVSLLITIYYK